MHCCGCCCVGRYLGDELRVYERDKDAFFKEFISVYITSQAAHFKAMAQLYSDAQVKIQMS